MFSGGQIRATKGILTEFQDDPEFLHQYLDRHFSGDWGDMSEDDMERNDEALFDGSRIFSAYELDCHLYQGRIWIITEAENSDGKRERTTVLLPSEY